MGFGWLTLARDTLWMQPSEEIRKLRLNRGPIGRHLGSARRRNADPRPLSRAISAQAGPVSWTIEGGAWHFWKSEEQPVKASQHLSQRKNWSDGGRRVGCVGFNFNIHEHGRFALQLVRRHAGEGLPFGLGKLKHIAARSHYVFGGISHL